MVLLGMIASWDFWLFLLGIIGVSAFTRLHHVIAKCDSKIFATICTIIAYLAITYLRTFH